MFVEQPYGSLPGAIPNQLITTGARYAELPNKLRHELTVGLGTGALGEPINTVTLPWAEANGARLTVAFSPATDLILTWTPRILIPLARRCALSLTHADPDLR